MYLWDILIKNNGPLERLRITPLFKHPPLLPPEPDWVPQTGQNPPVPQPYKGPSYVGAADLLRQQHLQNPQPILLVGPNGSGKSTAISIIADAMIELARQAFKDATRHDGSGSSLFFRPIGAPVVAQGATHYLTAALFRDGADDGRFLEHLGVNQGNLANVMGDVAPGLPLHQWAAERIPDDAPLPAQPGTKEASFSADAATRAFGQTIAAFFPASRFEDPIWLQGHAVERRQQPLRSKQFQGKMRQSVFTETALSEVLIWVERLLADSRLPVVEDIEKPGNFKVIPSYNHSLVTLSIQLRETVEKIIRLVTGDPVAALMHTPRGASELHVVVKGRAVPITALSTGEIGLFVIFVSLLMRAELGGSVASPAGAAGICLIDEVDAHLHVSHQVNVVPELIAMFPQVQFVMTAHSPLIGLGLANRIGAHGVMIIDLPNGQAVDPEDHGEFHAMFQAIGKTAAFRVEVEAATASLRDQGRPIVFVEGQTDRDYLEIAANQLSKTAVLQAVEVRIGANGAAGDGAVLTIIKNAKALQGAGILARPVLGLCDFDLKSDGTPKIFNAFEDNRVWLKRIPAPLDAHWWGHGIETLLAMEKPDDLITESRLMANGGGWQIQSSLNKVELCERVKANPALAGFDAFLPIFDLLEGFVASTLPHQPGAAQ